jgi:hypothetical protein
MDNHRHSIGHVLGFRYDDKNLVLVSGPAADAWLEAGVPVAGRLGIPLEVRRLPTADTRHGFELGPGRRGPRPPRRPRRLPHALDALGPPGNSPRSS